MKCEQMNVAHYQKKISTLNGLFIVSTCSQIFQQEQKAIIYHQQEYLRMINQVNSNNENNSSDDHKKPRKTKFQEILEAPKGCTEYNPHQSFALQVYWIVRSPRAASEMIQHGFTPCASATSRDTPTTITYLFRVSKDQRLAEQMKQEVLSIGQHPHYQPSFKSLSMGVPQTSVELKLRHGGIDTKPLSWAQDESIEAHREELDFDPVVLECTEIYLDNRSFYEHGASREWMTFSAEILKPARSLKPKTYCVGTPSQEIWEKTLESYLKAIRMDDETVGKDIHPGLFVLPENFVENVDSTRFFLELDLQVERDCIEVVRPLLGQLQKDLKASYMIILPINVDNDKPTIIELRIMLSFSHSSNIDPSQLKAISNQCKNLDGRLIVFGTSEEEDINKANHFVELSSITDSKLSILHSKQAENSILAGYPLHPLINTLTQNDQLQYQV